MASTHAVFNGQCKDTTFQSEQAWVKSPLWSVLIGHTAQAIDVHLDGLEPLLAGLYQTHALYPNIKELVAKVSAYPPNTKGIICRRALFLLALNREHEIASYFIEEERKIGPGVGPTRVTLLLLEALVPSYINDFCQDPDVFVRRCTQMLHMGWGHEIWESEMCKAHRDTAVVCTSQ